MMDIAAIEKENLTAKYSHKNTLMPRFAYSLDLLDMILTQLDKKRTELKSQNLVLYDHAGDTFDLDFTKLVELEGEVYFAIESLKQIQNRMRSISGIHGITTNLPSAISIIRIISSRLFRYFPNYSQNLCELSSILGSIVMDSATITEAKFDFGESNRESQRILDEAKLIVDSKINKQYPNLDLAKANLA